MVRGLPASRSGQARILEAVIASVLIFIMFSAAFLMLFSSERPFRQEAVDLNRLAYNVLHRLAESGIIDEALEGNQAGDARLRGSLESMLPQNVYFNLTIYAVSDPSRRLTTSNASQEVFEGAGEVALASIIYTSRRGTTYRLILKLTRIGIIWSSSGANLYENINNYIYLIEYKCA